MAESVPILYTNQSEMEERMGQSELLNFADDVGDREPDTNFIQNAALDATDEVNFYLARWYDPDIMSANRWIRHKAAYLGCYFLSGRKGNPPMFVHEVERIIQQLELVRVGDHQVPRLPFRDDYTPAMSNFIISDRHPTAKIRVSSHVSTGGRSGRQHLDYRQYFWY